MEIPRPSPRSQGGLPPIYIDDDGPPRPYGRASRSPFASSPFSPAFASIPMPIPNTSDEFRAPPPLPPPRVVPVPGPMSAAAEEYRRRERQREPVDDMPNYKMRLDRDEGYYSVESRSRDSFPSAAPAQQLSLQQGPYQFRPSSDAYDNSLLSKLDIRGTLDNRSPPRHGGGSSGGSGGGGGGGNGNGGGSGLSVSAHDLRPVDRFAVPQPLSLPTRMKQQHGGGGGGGGGPALLDSPSRYTDTPLHSAVSPRSAPFSSSSSSSHGPGLGLGLGGSGSGGYRSPKEAAASTPSDYSYYDRSPSVRTRRTDSGSLPPDDDDTGFPMDETSRLRDLRLDAAAAAAAAGPAPRPAHHASSSLSLALSAGDYHATGQKRRASSPPGGDELPPPLPLYGMPSSEHLRRRDGAARGAAAPRLRAVSPQDALSPSSASAAAAVAAAAAGPGRPGSYGSAHSPAATSATSAGSTCGTTASACTSPYMACAPSVPLTLLPRVAAGPRTPHRAGDAAGKPAGLLTRSDFFMCDCCPKKPKKFDSEEQLRAHEMEKQYECHYCGNRFKNKNEAERHQNSLHVRRHSWSCAALSGYDRAFHESTLRPGEVDMCGYCGGEFARSGHGRGGAGAGAGAAAGTDADTPAWHATDQDWDERIRHLQDVHKFRECNASKKFFRADHFRQHLKHSHAGTSGKWTNMLENACMIEEEPPLPMR